MLGDFLDAMLLVWGVILLFAASVLALAVMAVLSIWFSFGAWWIAPVGGLVGSLGVWFWIMSR